MSAMQDTALKYLRQLGAESKVRLTVHFALEVEEMAVLTSSAMQALQNFHGANPNYDANDPQQVAFGLMTKGVNTLMAAFELSLSGYLWEPSILLRSALEGCATAWDLVHNAPRFELWKAQRKFDSSDTNVKEVADEIGKLYGYLSKFSVHTSPINSSPSMVVVQEQPKFQFFGLVTPGKESVRTTEIFLCLFVTYICLQLTELVFHRYASELETIEKIPGDLRKRTDKVRILIREGRLGYEKLRLILDKSGQFEFTEQELLSMRQQLAEKMPTGGVTNDSFIVYSSTDGQD